MVNYTAGVVKINDTLSSLVRFENKNIFFHFVKTLFPIAMLVLQFQIQKP
jgi:hypothetical protein